eukprot:11085897-Alexandrium_andersonii.AAC.1
MLGIGDPNVPKAPPAHLRTEAAAPPSQQGQAQSQSADSTARPQVPVKMPPDHLLRSADPSVAATP